MRSPPGSVEILSNSLEKLCYEKFEVDPVVVVDYLCQTEVIAIDHYTQVVNYLMPKPMEPRQKKKVEDAQVEHPE